MDGSNWADDSTDEIILRRSGKLLQIQPSKKLQNGGSLHGKVI